MTTWINDQTELANLRDWHDRYRDMWKSRGRELNELYDAIAEAIGELTVGDPLKDIHSLAASHSALIALVALKDGPRDVTYEQLKPIAWDVARLCVS